MNDETAALLGLEMDAEGRWIESDTGEVWEAESPSSDDERALDRATRRISADLALAEALKAEARRLTARARTLTARAEWRENLIRDALKEVAAARMARFGGQAATVGTYAVRVANVKPAIRVLDEGLALEFAAEHFPHAVRVERRLLVSALTPDDLVGMAAARPEAAGLVAGHERWTFKPAVGVDG